MELRVHSNLEHDCGHCQCEKHVPSLSASDDMFCQGTTKGACSVRDATSGISRITPLFRVAVLYPTVSV